MHEKKPVKNDTPKTDTKLITEHRRAIIAGLVGDQGAVSSEELSSRFGVTHMTVYRDLKALETLGSCVPCAAGQSAAPPTLRANRFILPNAKSTKASKKTLLGTPPTTSCMTGTT